MVNLRKEYKKLIKQKKNEYRTNLIAKLEEIENKDPKEYWKLIGKLRKNKSEQKICNTDDFVSFFEKLFAKNENNTEHEKYVKEIVEAALKDAKGKGDFTYEEYLHALKILKINRSTGPDRIPAEALKACPEKLNRLLLAMINRIKSSTQYPEQWAEGLTSLLHKEGDDEDPNNFRAITVTNTISKLLAIMINERLQKFIQEKNIMKKEQIGFEKKTRPSDHLFVLKSLIDHYNGQGKNYMPAL